MNAMFLPLLAIASFGLSPLTASAQTAKTAVVNNQVLKVTVDQVDVFDATGAFVRQEAATSIAPLPLQVISHNADLGLIEVRTASGTFWVDEGSVDLKVPLKTSNITCRQNPQAKAVDHQTNVALGMTKCSGGQ